MRPLQLSDLAPKTLRGWCDFFHNRIGRPVLNRMGWNSEEENVSLTIQEFRSRLGETCIKIADYPAIGEVERAIDQLLNKEKTRQTDASSL